MIKSLMTNLFHFGSHSSIELQSRPRESIEEKNIVLNDNISLLSVYNGALSDSYRGDFLDVEVSRDIIETDMVVIIVTTSGCYLPNFRGFKKAIFVDHDNSSMSTSIFYKKYDRQDQTIYRVKKETDDLLITALTLRGPDMLIDAKAYIDTAQGTRGLAYAPRVKTANYGAVITCFSYADPIIVDIKNQFTVSAFTSDNLGQAVGISSSEDIKSERIKARSDLPYLKGKGDTLTCSLSLF